MFSGFACLSFATLRLCVRMVLQVLTSDLIRFYQRPSHSSAFGKKTLRLKEMSHRVHLLMEYPDDKNIGLTYPVKNSVSLVIMTANTLSDTLALMPHQWRVRQEIKNSLHIISVSIGLENTKVQQGIFIDGGEILRRKSGKFIQGASASPVRQCRAGLNHFHHFSPQPRQHS